MGTVGLAPGLSRKLKKVLECRTDSPDLVGSLNTLSTFYSENTAQARRNLRSTIEHRSLQINLDFLQASRAAQQVCTLLIFIHLIWIPACLSKSICFYQALDQVEEEVNALADCCDKYVFLFMKQEIVLVLQNCFKSTLSNSIPMLYCIVFWVVHPIPLTLLLQLCNKPSHSGLQRLWIVVVLLQGTLSAPPSASKRNLKLPHNVKRLFLASFVTISSLTKRFKLHPLKTSILNSTQNNDPSSYFF